MEIVTIHQAFGKAILQDIAIDLLHSGIYQPRDTFSEDALESLSKTIEQLGVLEPLIVRASTATPNQFEIIAGEGEVPLARDCVESLARELGLKNPESASYLELLLSKQEAPR